MFLQEIRDVGVPDLEMIDSKRLNKRCAYRLKLRQDLRNRFINEYLGTPKDYLKVKGDLFIKEGDLILIGDANNKRINWPLGKVTKCIKGKTKDCVLWKCYETNSEALSTRSNHS
ncbi:DUF5641 domain-containing protein [Trichonephila clavipes]|nr:DUF5641 domain-containing protein [Trichonephila clavipes]